MTSTTIVSDSAEPASASASASATGSATSSDGLLSWPARITLASLSAGAAVIHFSMVAPHAQEWLPLGVGFALSGWVQLVAAIVIVAGPSRRWLQASLVANASFMAAWAVSRTAGFPFGPTAGHVEAVTVVDGLCVALEALLMIGTMIVLVRPKVGARRSIPAFVGGAAVPALAVIALTTAALASPAGTHDHGAGGHGDHATAEAGDHHAGGHEEAAMDHSATGPMDHGHSDDHAHADVAEAADGETATGAAHGDHDHATAADHPLAAGADSATDGHDHEATSAAGTVGIGTSEGGHSHGADCSAPVTAEQQGAADDLIRETVAASNKYQDFNQAIADGYVAITPPETQLVHFGNFDYMTDGALLDPNRIESLMYAFDKNRTPYFVGTMYLNDDASIAPPAPGGCLMQWHDHTNLCIAEGKGMVATVKADGSCPEGSSNEVTSQMIHVWTIQLPKGPLTHDATPDQIKAGVIKLKINA